MENCDTKLWSNSVRLERRTRSRLSVFVQWHQLEVDTVAEDVLTSRLVAVPDWRGRSEVPQGFWNEMDLL